MKKPPYYHADGSNCWTKNCKKGSSSVNPEILDKKQEALDNLYASISRKTMINEIAPLEDFYAASKQGDIIATKHPSGLPYTLFKYTPRTQATKKWNDVTLNSRGLIVNHETGEIVARPFGKFFNYGEEAVQKDLMTGPISVSEKLDGSLGISYRNPEGEMRINTSGGWQAPQSKFATEFYKENYEGNWEPDPERTYMWEILHPQNRIVVDYGEEKDLHLIGAVNIRTGKSIPLDQITEWTGKRAKSHNFNSLTEVVTSPDRANHEGYIVHFTDTDYRVKVKHDEYVRIHRDATGLNERRVWDSLRTGNRDVKRAEIQEEFYDYFDEHSNKIQAAFDARINAVHTERERLIKSFTGTEKMDWVNHVRKEGKKEYQAKMLSSRDRVQFTELDISKIWQAVKPAFVKMDI